MYEEDLEQCSDDFDQDGVRDLDDICPDTPKAAEVDQAGCSLEQFCASIDTTTRLGKRICKGSDWKNDEPLRRPADRDCTIDRGGPGVEDDRCVAKVG